MQKIINEHQNSTDKIKERFLGSEIGWELTFDAIPDLIAILDRDHRVVKVNRAMADKLKQSPENCIGAICYQVVHNSDEPPKNCPHKKLLSDGVEHRSEVEEKNLGGYFLVTASPILDLDGSILGSIHIAHDITHRKEMEKKLEKTLEDKDILMKEIYHRVKNNLMVISSLLSLQSMYITDKHTQDIFRESQYRAKAMALIHEKLYRSTDLKSIDFTEYTENLTKDLYNTYTSDKSLIKLVVDIEEVKLDVETSIPLGLILNELLTNSLKHGFPENRSGEVTVELHCLDENEFELSVSDNGIGFPEDIDYKNTDSLGMRIVNSLTEQIEGELIIDRDNGTKFTIKFKNQEY